jgi:hypothetical protein
MEILNKLPTDIHQNVRDALIVDIQNKRERAMAHIRSKPYIDHLKNLINLHITYTEIGSNFSPVLIVYPWRDFLFQDGWLDDRDEFVWWCLMKSYENDFQNADQWNDWHENVAYIGIPTVGPEPPFLT